MRWQGAGGSAAGPGRALAYSRHGGKYYPLQKRRETGLHLLATAILCAGRRPCDLRAAGLVGLGGNRRGEGDQPGGQRGHRSPAPARWQRREARGAQAGHGAAQVRNAFAAAIRLGQASPDQSPSPRAQASGPPGHQASVAETGHPAEAARRIRKPSARGPRRRARQAASLPQQQRRDQPVRQPGQLPGTHAARVRRGRGLHPG